MSHSHPLHPGEGSLRSRKCHSSPCSAWTSSPAQRSRSTFILRAHFTLLSRTGRSSFAVSTRSGRRRRQSPIPHPGGVLTLPESLVNGFATHTGATVYLFGPRTQQGLGSILAETQESALAALRGLEPKALSSVGQPTTDVREKYWGRIETIASGDVAAKRIFVRKGGQSSLEYHVEKSESYYIHSGLLKVGLRIGRAENRSI